DYQTTGKQYEQYLASLQKNNIQPVTLKEAMVFSLGDANYTLNSPEVLPGIPRLENDYSLVVSLRHGKNSFLFAGDAQDVRLIELIDGGNLQHDFLKVPYHGKYIQMNQAFFEAVQPQYAVITCSEKNPEEDATVEALTKTGAQIYLTRNGDVACISDGSHLEVIQ
ncbi:MAG: ComEC/Rec2 family competence protein, partial [Christensenellales bacterium]